MCLAGSALDALALEQSEKTLRHSISVAITMRAYRVFQLASLYENTRPNSHRKKFLLVIGNSPIDSSFVHAKTGCNF